MVKGEKGKKRTEGDQREEERGERGMQLKRGGEARSAQEENNKGYVRRGGGGRKIKGRQRNLKG